MSMPTIAKQDVLPDISPENIGFHALNGDKKVKILPSPWTEDAGPPSCASLLSIASANGLYAAGSPDGVVIGKTQTIKDAIYAAASTEPTLCDPLQTLPTPRPLHVAFASDESCLIVIGQPESEIKAYTIQSLVAGKLTPDLTLGLPSSVRACVPNPEPTQAQYFALVTTQGQLVIADLQRNELLSGSNGHILAENVVCVAWSSKGKQLIAGRADATAVQITPDGSIKCRFPKPDSVPENCHLAQVVWIENNTFFFNYTPASITDVGDVISEQYIVHADKERTRLSLQKADMDLFFAAIEEGLPAQFHAARLRGYEPYLDEVVFLVSTIAPEIATITKASKPLDPNSLSEENAYTVSRPHDDQRWAAMPVDPSSGQDTYPIGFALDLSDRFPVVKPVPSDSDIENSTHPLPELLALNQQGILSCWAFVYEDAIRQKKQYAGFEALKQLQLSASTDQSSPAGKAGQNHLPQSSNISGAKVTPLTSNLVPPDQNPQTGSTFGQSTPLSTNSTPSWTNTGFGDVKSSINPAFGQPPAFGSSPALGQTNTPVFGAQGAIGGNAKTSSSPAFGQSGFGNTPKLGPKNSTFASLPETKTLGQASTTASAFTNSSTSGGFGSFASKGGFGSFSNATTSGFGSGGSFDVSKTSGSFASAATNSPSVFSPPSSNATFGQATPIGRPNPSSSAFSSSNKGFRLQSTFQKDKTSVDRDDEVDDSSNSFGFGGSLGNMLSRNQTERVTSPTKEEDMDDGDDVETTDEELDRAMPNTQKTPPATISTSKSHTTPPVSSLFGNSQPSTTPLSDPQASGNEGWTFGPAASTTPKDTPAPHKAVFGTKPTADSTPAAVQLSKPSQPFAFTSISKEPSDSARVKSLASDDESEITEPPDAPLPPDPFSKPAYQLGDTSASSINSRTSKDVEDAPLPPDFMPISKSRSTLERRESSIQSDLLSDDFDGSGEDLTGEVSPVELKGSQASQDHVEISPESSFGPGEDRSRAPSPVGGAFTNIKLQQPKTTSRPLFAEIGGPVFPPPQRQDDSPRSPSPMRKPPRNGALSRSPDRSVSAPAHRGSLIAQRKHDHQQSAFAMQAAQAERQQEDLAQWQRDQEQETRAKAKAKETKVLEDDEDEAVRAELQKATQPSERLDPFVAIQPGKALQGLQGGQSDVPAQIEVLYQDINSMIVTLGINAKSLSAFMMYQTSQEDNESWPSVLSSDTPMDVLNDEWLLADTPALIKGQRLLSDLVDKAEVVDVGQTLEQCSDLLGGGIADLRQRISALQRSTRARARSGITSEASLSAEQSSIQYELRKATASVYSNLAQLEDQLGVLRARVADLAPAAGSESDMFAASRASIKKPSVEAVMSTVAKMTTMAEKRSADVDVLEAQIRRMNLTAASTKQIPSTPERQIDRQGSATPGSTRGSVFYTPDSVRFRSRLSTPSRGSLTVASNEEKAQWQAKARRKKAVSQMLRSILTAKNER